MNTTQIIMPLDYFFPSEMSLFGQSRREFLARTIPATGALLATGTVHASSDAVVDADDPAAYDSIQRAVNDSPSGSTIEVTAGIYEESVFVPPTKSITIRGDTGGSSRGAGPDAPVIDGNGEPRRAGISLPGGETAGAVTIEGIVVRNFGEDLPSPGEKPVAGNGVQTGHRANVTVRDSTFENIVGSGVSQWDQEMRLARGLTVRRCRFDSIAHSGIGLASPADSNIVDNEVVVTRSVPDAEGQWWEETRPSGDPVHGLSVAMHPPEDGSQEGGNVVIRGNDVTGQFDVSGINVFSHNNTGNGHVLFDTVELRDNSVTVPSDSTNVYTTGIKVDSNAGPHDLPAAIRNVVLRGNDVENAKRAYRFVTSAANGDNVPGGITAVTCSANTATRCDAGFEVTTTRSGDVAAVSLVENTCWNCNQGVVLWSAGSAVQDNSFHRDSAPAPDEWRYAVEPVALSGDIRSVSVSGSTVQNHSHGVGAFALNGGTASDIKVTDCTFAENRGGVFTQVNTDDGTTVELTARRCKFERNHVGASVERNGDGSDLHLHSCDFVENEYYGVENSSGNGIVDATCNYWGAPAGPTVEDGQGPGRGDRVSPGVAYDPLLSQSFTEVPKDSCHPAPGSHSGKRGSPGRSRGTKQTPRPAGHPPDNAAASTHGNEP